MTLPALIWGMIRRPAVTCDRARREMGGDFWFIILTVLSLQVVLFLHSPLAVERLTLGQALVVAGIHYVLLVQVQALLLMGTARLFGWRPSFMELVRLIGLAWSILLVETLLGFYPVLTGMQKLLFWGALPIDLWYVAVLSIGAWRWSGLTPWQAAAAVVLAILPIFVPLYLLQYSQLP
jgi:hypothetical protein